MELSIFTPVVAFGIYFLLAGGLSMLGRWLSASQTTSTSLATYASGEGAADELAAPGYRPFFVVSLFFAILHLGVLVLATGDFSAWMGVYLVGLVLALLALVLG